MKILVTGGTGFIGSHLIEKLIEMGHDVSVIVRHSTRPFNFQNNVKTITADLLDKHSLTKAVTDVQPEIVCHLAAFTPVRFSFDNPFIYAETNYIGTMNMVFCITQITSS